MPQVDALAICLLSVLTQLRAPCVCIASLYTLRRLRHRWQLLCNGSLTWTHQRWPHNLRATGAGPRRNERTSVCALHVTLSALSVAAGVIAYEAITDAPAFGFSKREQVMACARGERAYAWEPSDSSRSGGNNSAAFERSRVRGIVLQCLARDPCQRPTAPQLVRAIDRISNATRTATLAPARVEQSTTIEAPDAPDAEPEA